MIIIVAGRGNMATALGKACASYGDVKVLSLEMLHVEETLVQGQTVAVHFGSGKRLPALFDLCKRQHIPLIQGSTNAASTDLEPPKSLVYVRAPNLCLPMIRFIAAFPAFAEAIRSGTDVAIAESHQAGKEDVSGTARAVADAINVSQTEIAFVREPSLQRILGVPEQSLKGHAYHWFTFSASGVQIQVSTKINDRSSYAEGAIALARVLIHPLTERRNGVYNVTDLLPLLL